MNAQGILSSEMFFNKSVKNICKSLLDSDYYLLMKCDICSTNLVSKNL